MRRDNGTDWNLARMLRLQGLTLEDIAKKLGCNLSTLKSRSSREKWSEKVAIAREEGAKHATEVVNRAITKRAEQWADKLVTRLERNADTIANLKPVKSRKGLIEDETLLAQHIKNGRSMFGLDAKDSAGPAVAVGLNFSIDLGKVGQHVEQPAIEVSDSVDSQGVTS